MLVRPKGSIASSPSPDRMLIDRSGQPRSAISPSILAMLENMMTRWPMLVGLKRSVASSPSPGRMPIYLIGPLRHESLPRQRSCRSCPAASLRSSAHSRGGPALHPFACCSCRCLCRTAPRTRNQNRTQQCRFEPCDHLASWVRKVIQCDDLFAPSLDLHPVRYTIAFVRRRRAASPQATL